MKLTIAERLIVMDVLPTTGDITTVKIIRDLRHALEFSEEELSKHNIRVAEDNRILWDSEGDKEVEIGSRATSIIVETLEALNKEKKLTENHISVYEKFTGV